MNRLAATQLRGDLTETINRVAYGGERVILERHGREMAAIVSMEDLALLEAMENKLDIEEARAALAEAREMGTRSLAEFEAEMGL